MFLSTLFILVRETINYIVQVIKKSFLSLCFEEVEDHFDFINMNSTPQFMREDNM